MPRPMKRARPFHFEAKDRGVGWRWNRRLSHHGHPLIADALVYSEGRQTWTA